MWCMRRGGHGVRSWIYYIIGTYRRLLQNVAVWDAQNNADYYLVLGCLRVTVIPTHLSYLSKRSRFPINPPTTLEGADRLFAEFREAIPKPPWQERLQQA